MTFGRIIQTLLIGPLKLVFEILFNSAYQITQNVGVSIFLLSLAMNFLVLPLYRCADAMQERAREKEAELHDGIAHIKKTFKGDEKMMMLQTYYRQNHYSPLSALSGSVSLLLEIPFFIAAYQFLSDAAILAGASLGPIGNLADPDALIRIGSFSINVLPFLMTIINIIASVLYLKGAPLQSKIQLYAMALFFLVFLYDSPAGLLFYWTLNNVFSLVKTIFYKLKNPRKILMILSSVSGVLVFAAVMIFQLGKDPVKIASTVLLFVAQLPLAIYYLKKVVKLPKSNREWKNNPKLFLLGGLFLTVLTGMLIPSALLGDQPQEFVNFQYYQHPNWYLVSSTCLAAGTFLVWFSVFYWLASPKGKAYFDIGIWIACAVFTIDYMFFGTNLGNISAALVYDSRFTFPLWQHLLNAFIIIGAAVGMYFVITKFQKVTVSILAVAILAIGGMSTFNITKINKGIDNLNVSAVEQETPVFTLSKGGQNVVVIMLDRGLGAYFPFLHKEVTERRGEGAEPFLSGFTYYSNVISYGDRTNFGSPAMLGGYEYTPVELNKRDSLKLAEKQNEANLLLPRIFTEQWENCDGATVFDPVYTNYQWISDLSVFDEYDDITANNVLGDFMDANQYRAVMENKHRDFFCFSLMKSVPLALQRAIYMNGNYHRVATKENRNTYSGQVVEGISKATGVRAEFMQNYYNLTNMAAMTEVEDSTANKYVFVRNDICHEPMLLDENIYEPIDPTTGEVVMEVDNTAYDEAHADRFTVGDKTLSVKNGLQMSHYQTNLMTLVKLDEWFTHLKAEGLYDNTRIIIVADHGYYLDTVDDLYHEEIKGSVEKYFPLLLVKDFNARGGVQTDDTFMTNADVPTLATQGIIENPVNPFTGKAIDNSEKTAHPQYIIDSKIWQTENNNGNAFIKAKWISVQDSIWNADNWKFHKKETVLKEHAAP